MTRRHQILDVDVYLVFSTILYIFKTGQSASVPQQRHLTHRWGSRDQQTSHRDGKVWTRRSPNRFFSLLTTMLHV